MRKRAFVVPSWRGAGVLCSCFGGIASRIINMWFLNPRFSRWQAYHTPSGYAATNNPLETYHHTLKLINNSKRATPTELVSRLDLSRIAYESSATPFATEAKVSKRMKAAYVKADKSKAFTTSLVHRVQNSGLILVRVLELMSIGAL
ncbi:hypothetical protein JG687_00019037 [Phytophthora cactorum]|uniref:Uncharacterized protein n=1 Tax=Phytophthora cactorum TaxID=29920 RepID=A0A8T1TM96_9STRA|nr:hypothetical protein GQ600_9302 [Phytophthora cactorum]KAF1787363.1 hypothetical protein GQ600_6086 [Phytophthora cactorum]KAG6942472.1 hypothetical protein JG687_00019037 [Phytophthora cactorum]